MAQGLFNLKQVMQGIQQGDGFGQRPPAVEYLVVAGGGSGGGNQSAGSGGGGGGAGGLLQGFDPVPNGQTLLVTVGAGGTGSRNIGITGNNSVFGSITSNGGGGAGAGSAGSNNAGLNGGSGGGGGANAGSYNRGGLGISGQGNSGGDADNAAYASGDYPAAGGGGAGTRALSIFSSNVATSGGFGIASSISGTTTAYAGGGGGSTYNSAGTPGVGGVGGGGAGTNQGGVNGTSGTANTGGGGGGAWTGNGGNGGSGIVIVSYPDVYAAAASTTGSPTVSTSGSGSISLNGTNQNLSYATSALFSFGTGDFTIEAWVYKTTNTGADMCIMDARVGATGTPWALYINSSNQPFFYTGTSYISSIALSLNTWTHVAVSRSGTTLTVFVNGAVGNTTTVSTNLDRSAGLVIGSDPGSSFAWFSGYMSNLRVVKGTAVYTSAFTPSTVPLTAVSGTSLLLNSISGSYLADRSTNSLIASVSNTPTWNASSPFTVTGYKNRVYTWTSSGSITF